MSKKTFAQMEKTAEIHRNFDADTYIKEYEQMTGEKANRAVRQFAESLFNTAASFEAKGREDGAKGLPVPGADAFTHWATQVFDDDVELAADMADLMQMAYMHGYQAAQEVSA